MAVKANETERQMIFTSKIVDEATDKINDGVVVKRYQNPWMKSEVGIRRAGVSFRMTPEEQQEYVRCALDIHYFTEKYCKTKREDGSVGSITLRNYQKEILDNFVNNRFNILMASRQVGKCNVLTTRVLCLIIDDLGNENEVNIPMYKLLYILNPNKKTYDYIKFGIYRLIDLLT
jgi:hypothetical protein